MNKLRGNFFRGVGRAPGTRRLHFGDDPDPLSLLCSNFRPVMHFQWDSNSLLSF